MKKLILAFLFFLPYLLAAQGKIVLVGGGSEEPGGWSDAPYTWAVEQATNKKVIILSYQGYDNVADSSFYPDYFKKLGATQASNLLVNSSNADNQVVYDKLMAADLIFMRGGDQSLYYDYYKGKKAGKALQDKFNAGGVLMGTSAGAMILAGVASLGDAYPNEMLQDLANPYAEMQDDFLTVLPKTIVDTHFIQRGRFPRLLGLLAKRFLNNAEELTGIGVDDMTAICIKNGVGEVFGSASVTVYPPTNGYKKIGKTFSIERLRKIALISGDKINLSTFEVTTNALTVNVQKNEQVSALVMLSGTENTTENQSFLSDFAAEGTGLAAKVVIITKADTITAEAYRKALKTAGATQVALLQAISTNATNADFAQKLAQAQKVLFVANNFADLKAFLTTENGKKLSAQIKKMGIVVGFIGENSNLAGAYLATNVASDKSASFNGRLQIESGLGLFLHTAIISNTYGGGSAFRDFYENKSSALTYLMMDKKLGRGFWLSPTNYLKYRLTSKGGMMTALGTTPVLMIENDGAKSKFASVKLLSTNKVRNIVSYDGLLLTAMETSKEYLVRELAPTDILSFEIAGIAASIDPTTATIQAIVSATADLKNLKANVELVQGATITPDPTTVADYSTPVVYTVKNGDAQQVWTVKVNRQVRAVFEVENADKLSVENAVKFSNTSLGNSLTYLWSFGDAALSTSAEKSPSFTYSKSGEYTVSLRVSDGLTSDETSKKITINPPASIEDIQEAFGLKVYPNPTSRLTQISWADHDFELMLYSLTGKLVLQGLFRNQAEIDFSHQLQGVYLVNLRDTRKGKIYQTKLVLTH